LTEQFSFEEYHPIFYVSGIENEMTGNFQYFEGRGGG
jgi:hypothetical protein